MQIGAMNHPGRDPAAEVDWFGRYGFDFVDFTFEPPAAMPGDARPHLTPATPTGPAPHCGPRRPVPKAVDLDAVRTKLERYRLDVVAHTAWYLPIASPFPSVRQAALHELMRALHASQQLGARMMNVHYHKLPPLLDPVDVLAWHVETLAALCDEADSLGITVVVENVPKAGPNQLEHFADILERVPQLGVHLDSGHARLEGGRGRWNEYIGQLGHRIRHVHLSDNDGTSDQHLPLGAVPFGGTPWPDHLAKLKSSGYDGTITLEVFAPAREHLLTSRDLLRRWWDAAPDSRNST